MARRRRDAFEKLMDSIWGARVTDFFRELAEGELRPKTEERLPPRKHLAPRVVTPYDILGVSPTAPRHVFEACYRAWAKQLHPDVTGDGAAMRRINVAADAIRKERGVEVMTEKSLDEKVKEAVEKIIKPEVVPPMTWEIGCKDCGYAREIQGALLVVGEQQYECRRYPPSPFPVQQQAGGKTAMASLSIFPPVRAMGTVCGEWRQKGTVPSARSN